MVDFPKYTMVDLIAQSLKYGVQVEAYMIARVQILSWVSFIFSFLHTFLSSPFHISFFFFLYKRF